MRTSVKHYYEHMGECKLDLASKMRDYQLEMSKSYQDVQEELSKSQD